MLNWDPGVLVIVPEADTKGAMWQKMWERAGFDLAQVKWSPLEQFTIKPGQRPVGSSIHTLITMGEQALTTVTQNSDLFRWRGRPQVVYSWGMPCLIVATMRVTDLLAKHVATTSKFSSQLLNRPSRYQGVWIRDVQFAHAKAGQFTRYQDNYLLDPKKLQEWDQFVERLLDEKTQISFDIETQYTPKGLRSEDDGAEQRIQEGALLRIAFSNRPHSAASVPYSSQFIPGIKRLLGSDIDKLGWNCLSFDVPRLANEGITVGGRIRDFQDAWHILESDLPKGLEWVSSFYTNVMPWKDLSDTNFARYAAMDADIALQNAIGIEQDLKKFGQWDLFERHVTDLMPILWKAGRRGNFIDLAYQAKLREEMEQEKAFLRSQASLRVPRECRPRTRVATKPAIGIVDYDVVYGDSEIKICSVCKEPMPNKSVHLKGGKKNPCHGATTQIVKGKKEMYDIVDEFNLGSSDQIQDYAKHFGHPLGYNHKTKSVTMDKNHIAKLDKQFGVEHPIYGEILKYSQVAKTLSTYMYIPDDLGLIHTTYVNAPSTWRLASRDYNLQNVGKRESNKWAKKARRQIIARPGHVFVQADSTSIEAVVTGKLIGDEQFVATAKKSIHAYLVCQELGWQFTDANIARTKAEHKDLYNQFKTAVYLLLYGGDPYLMHMTNPELFPHIADAVAIQKKIFKAMPALEKWQERTREQAKREGNLQSPYGYTHKFYDVYTFKRNQQGDIEYDVDGKPKLRMGQDSKRALAFIPQNCAGAFCRDTLLLIGQSKWAQYMCANVSVHDSYCLEVPESLADEAISFLIDILTRPVLELGNLRIGCEVDKGYNWADYDDDNPRGMKVVRKVEV